LAASGCGEKATQQAAAPPPPAVKVAAVARETIPVVMPFAATVQAVQVVDIVPRVSGYIDERYFEEGTFVEKDAPLYLIDPRPYKARLDALEAQLKQDQAQVEFWDAEAERYERLAKKGDVSK
jgi:multidrug efflux system membrane fusion protein